MSDDILVLTERKDNADNLEPCDVREEQVSLADMRSARKIPHRSCHAGKTLLEQRNLIPPDGIGPPGAARFSASRIAITRPSDE